MLMAVMRKELEPGLHISRRSVDDFHRFLRITRFFTSFVRLREACPAAALNLQPHLNAGISRHVATTEQKHNDSAFLRASRCS